MRNLRIILKPLKKERGYHPFSKPHVCPVSDEVKEKMGHPINRKKQAAMYKSLR